MLHNRPSDAVIEQIAALEPIVDVYLVELS